MNVRERIQNGVAAPDLLRRLFLTRMAKHLSSLPVKRNRIRESINQLEKSLDPMYWSILNKYIELLKRVEKARSKKEDSEEKDGPENSDQNGSRAKNDAEKNKESGEKEKELRRIIQEVTREWNRFVEKTRNKEQEKLKELNQILSLYRGRNHLYSDEKRLRKNALQIKRRIGLISRMQEEGDVFSDRETVRKMLRKHGKAILRAYSDFLLGKNWPVNAYKRMSGRPGLKNLNQKRYESFTWQFNKQLRVYSYSELQNTCKTLDQNIDPIATRLQEGTFENNDVGQLLSDLRRIVKKARDRLARDVKATRVYYKTYTGLSFNDPETFKKKFTERIKKLQEQIYGTTKKEPEPTGQQLMEQCRKLQRRVRTELGEAGE